MEAVEPAAGQRRDVSGDGTGSKKLVTTVALGARFRVPTVPWECQRCTCDAKLRFMSLTLQAATADFLAAMRAKSPSTRATYGTGLRRFVAWRGPETTLAELDDGLLERFYLDLVDEFGRERQAHDFDLPGGGSGLSAALPAFRLAGWAGARAGRGAPARRTRTSRATARRASRTAWR